MVPTVTTFSSGGKTVSAELYAPTTPSKGVIVIAYGSDGLVGNASGAWATMIRGYAADLAQAGSFVLIPDYPGATGTAVGLDSVLPALPAHSSDWEAIVADALAHGTTLAPAGSRKGLLGFSLGGFLSLRVRGKANVLSSYFAPYSFSPVGPANIGPVVAGSLLTVAEIHHGDDDHVVSYSNATQIIADLTAQGVATDLYTYPDADHGFGSFGNRPSANVVTRTQSKTRTLAFFATHL